MIVTTLHADVAPDRQGTLVDSFERASETLPDAIDQSLLLHETGSDLWKIVTVWTTREALTSYRDSVETPEGVAMFRSAGAEPSLTVFEVAAHAAHQ